METSGCKSKLQKENEFDSLKEEGVDGRERTLSDELRQGVHNRPKMVYAEDEAEKKPPRRMGSPLVTQSA